MAGNSRFERSQKKASYVGKYLISVEPNLIKEEKESIKRPV